MMKCPFISYRRFCCLEPARKRMQFYVNDFVSEKVKQAWNNMWNSKVNIPFLLTLAGGRRKRTTGHLTDDCAPTWRFILSIYLLHCDRSTCRMNDAIYVSDRTTRVPLLLCYNYICFICIF